MPNLKALKKRIDSVKSTRKITSAMKMVAASKLRRAQEQVESARPFSERMSRVVASVAAGLPKTEDLPKMISGTGKDDVVLMALITSERGLCGALNTNLLRSAKRRIQELLEQGKQVKILCIGKKGRDMLRREYGDYIIDWSGTSNIRQIAYIDTKPIAERLTSMFDAGEFDSCFIYYNEFESVMVQNVTEHQIIPVVIEDAPIFDSGASYESEPDEEQVLANLLPRSLAMQVFRALLENSASEQGARMTAMDNATRNAGEMIDRLTISYNRARQAAITTELTEIISGAEAV